MSLWFSHTILISLDFMQVAFVILPFRVFFTEQDTDGTLDQKLVLLLPSVMAP